MRGRRTSIITITLLILSLAFAGPNVSAHSGGIFWIMIKSDSPGGVYPVNASIIVNDTARWQNLHNTTGTHRIFVDMDEDGDYFGTEDLDSGNLTYSCETDNGTKVDEECNDFFDIPFNYTGADGKYAYVDIASTGNRTYGNVTVNPDTHLTPGFQQQPEKEVKEDSDPVWLLAVAAISGIGAVVLGAMIVFGNKDEN